MVNKNASVENPHAFAVLSHRCLNFALLCEVKVSQVTDNDCLSGEGFYLVDDLDNVDLTKFQLI